MTKKTKLLLTSFATIAMSASLVVGGTYALFTSETQVNVGVQAGTVEIKATVADNVLTKSRVGWGEWSGTPVTTGTTIFSAFENGGGATFTENSVNLELMTPGDQVQFTIDLDNKSNVNAMYRTVVLPTEDTGLLKGLEITFTDVTTAETEKLGSETFIGAAVADWAQLPENKSDVERKILVTITLPKDAGNEYQKKTAKLVYYVEAIQGNADVNNGNVVDAQGYTLIQSATDLWRLSAQYANPNKVSVLSTTQALPKYRLAANIDLNGAPFMPIGTVENPFLGEFDGNGYTVSNFTITGNEAVGLFGFADGGNQKLTVKNLTVKDATINGSHWVGGIVGKLSGNLENCTVENVTVTAVPLNNMNGDKVGGIVGWTSRGEVKGCTAKDVTVAGYRDIGGLVGAAVADNWVTVTGNTVDGATLSFVEGYQAFDEKGVYEEQKNIAPVAGRKVGNAVVENNSTLDATTPTQIFAGKQAALEAALAADYAEIEIGASFEVSETVVIPAGKEVTLDLNGNTIAVDETFKGAALKNQGELTIDGDGKIDVSGSTKTTQAVDNYGDLILNSGTYVGTMATYSYTIRSVGGSVYAGDISVEGGFGGVAVNDGAELVINDGVYKNGATGGGHVIYAQNGAKVTVNGGLFDDGVGKKDQLYQYSILTYGADCVVNVFGGTFNSLDNTLNKMFAIVGDDNNTSKINLYGGTYSSVYFTAEELAADLNKYAPTGYQAVENADGTYTVKMKALTPDPENENLIKIGTAAELFAFAASVNDGVAVSKTSIERFSYSGKTVELTADIDLGGAEWIPVGQTGAHGSFNGIFDGKGYTISNFYINGMDKGGIHYSSAFFGWIESHNGGGIVKNLTIDNVEISGNHNVAGIVGRTNAPVENCKVTNAVISNTYNDGEKDGDKTGAIVGYLDTQYSAKVSNCSAENVRINAGRDAGQLIGAAKTIGLGEGNTATDVTVVANGTGSGANIRNEFIGRVL